MTTKSKKSKAKPKTESRNGYQARLKVRYREEFVPALVKELGYANPMQAPRIEKISVNIGLGEALQDSKAVESATSDLESITGQHPVITRAKKSIAAFKVREGMVVGLRVTLRGNRMYEFLDRLINTSLPRIRDFRGISADAFDGRGNYTLGIREQTLFPEIDYAQIDRPRGLEVSIATTAKTDEEGRSLLNLFGMPFAASGE